MADLIPFNLPDADWPHPDIAQAAFVAPSAILIGRVTLAVGSSVWPTAVLRGDVEQIQVGAYTNVQDGAVIHCDPGQPVILEASVTVGHRAVIHGAYVEQGSLVGIGAIILNGVRIGAGSMIGAGAVVTKDVPPRSLVMGVPGKVVKPVSAEQAQGLVNHAQEYFHLAQLHQRKASAISQNL